jgi:hypothetical protein
MSFCRVGCAHGASGPTEAIRRDHRTHCAVHRKLQYSKTFLLPRKFQLGLHRKLFPFSVFHAVLFMLLGHTASKPAGDKKRRKNPCPQYFCLLFWLRYVQPILPQANMKFIQSVLITNKAFGNVVLHGFLHATLFLFSSVTLIMF